MKLIYGICYYDGSGKTQNITRHVGIFNELKVDNKQFVVALMSDSPTPSRPDEIPGDAIVVNSFNWGGTVSGLWGVYNEFKCHDANDIVAFFEEDFYPTNTDWLKDSKELLEQNEYIYIGEHIPNDSFVDNDNNTKHMPDFCNWKLHGIHTPSLYESHDMELNSLRWTDGGFYFSTIENLTKIDKKIGVFHKGNQDTKYHRTIDGILLGEVGFPSLVNKHFKFTGLPRATYFVHI